MFLSIYAVMRICPGQTRQDREPRYGRSAVEKWRHCELYLLSRTYTWRTMYERMVNPPKNMPRNATLGHQNDCARSPKVERIVAAGTSRSTPYYNEG